MSLPVEEGDLGARGHHRAADGSSPLLSVLVPVLNEAKTLEALLSRVLGVDLPLEVILVDDGSTDGTWSIMQAHVDGTRVFAYQHASNRGKGAALHTALSKARGDYVIIQDADLEYDPREYRLLFEPVLEKRAEVVYGTRPFSSHTNYSFWYVMGNKVVTLAANVLYNYYLSDLATCYKLMPRELALSLNLKVSGFDVDAEITAKLLKHRHRIYQVPITYVARSRDEGKKVTVKDGIKALLTLLRCRWSDS
jgi:glycosyltransferase involved in cell wall biosynthesis